MPRRKKAKDYINGTGWPETKWVPPPQKNRSRKVSGAKVKPKEAVEEDPVVKMIREKIKRRKAME